MAGQVDIDIVISWSFLYRGHGEQIAGPYRISCNEQWRIKEFQNLGGGCREAV